MGFPAGPVSEEHLNELAAEEEDNKIHPYGKFTLDYGPHKKPPQRAPNYKFRKKTRHGIHYADRKYHHIPGPGTYGGNNILFGRDTPKFRFKKEKKLKTVLDTNKDIIKVPGPGSYSQEGQKLKESAPHYSFGKTQSTRPQYQKQTKNLRA